MINERVGMPCFRNAWEPLRRHTPIMRDYCGKNGVHVATMFKVRPLIVGTVRGVRWEAPVQFDKE